MAQPVKKKGKSMNLIAQPVALSRTPSKLKTWPPDLGQHTDAVLKEFGFKAGEIAALRKANAI
jgi:formyl-CoA transferase